MGRVYVGWHSSCPEEVLYFMCDLFSHIIPVGLKKSRRKSIGAWCFISMNCKHCFSDLLCRWYLDEFFIVSLFDQRPECIPYCCLFISRRLRRCKHFIKVANNDLRNFFLFEKALSLVVLNDRKRISSFTVLCRSMEETRISVP